MRTAPATTTTNASKKFIAVLDGDVPEAGAIVYWNEGAPCDAAALADAWAAAGLDPAHLPADKSPEVALREAVDAVCTRTRFRRPRKGGGWLVVDEAWQGEAPAWGEAARCTLDVVGRLQVEFPAAATTPEGVAAQQALADALAAAYDTALGTMSGSDVSAWLVRLTYVFRAVVLRAHGGVYFIPHDVLPQWRAAASVVEAVCRPMRVEEITTVLVNGQCERTVRAILHAVEEEAAAEVQGVLNDITAADAAGKPLGKRALETRAARAAELRAKVARYAELLGQNLDTLIGQVEQAAATVATARMAADSARAA
jgi:hypothetical protein